MEKSIDVDLINLFHAFTKSKVCGDCGLQMKRVWKTKDLGDGWTRAGFLEFEWRQNQHKTAASFVCSACERVVNPASQPFRWGQ